jgi:putative hydrolase of the HAD superfamily
VKHKHVFFDLDHTLWDFERNSTNALNHLFLELKLNEEGVLNSEDFIRVYQKVNEECWRAYRHGLIEKDELRFRRFALTFERFGVFNETLAKKLGEGYVDLSPRMTALVDGTQDTLDYLGAKYHLHIITNGFKEIQHIKIQNSGISHHFQQVIISEDVGQKKPHRAVFDFALKASDAIAEESIMIGDDLEADVLGARDAGWDQVFYNPSRIDHKEQIAFEVEHLSELKSIL